MSASSLSAQTIAPTEPAPDAKAIFYRGPVNRPADAPASRASGSVAFTYVQGNPRNAFRMDNARVDIAGAIALDEETTTLWAGNRITAVEIASAPQCSGMPFKVFVTDNPQDLTQNNVAGSYRAAEWTYNTITLAAPVEIKAGTKLYVGFTATADPIKYPFPFVVDNIPNDDDDSCILFKKNGNKWNLSYDSESYGALCIKAIIEGDKLVEDHASISASGSSVVNAGSDMDINVSVSNKGANEISDVEIEVRIAAQQPVTFQKRIRLSDFNSTANISLKVPCTTVGRSVEAKVRLLKVNGVEQPVSDASEESLEFLSLPEGTGFQRNMVVEEFTGTWCGYCPYGIYGMEKMFEEHPDGTFIPIAIHSGDEMQIDYGAGTGNYPSCNIGRMPEYMGVYPSYANMNTIYNHLVTLPALASISVGSDPAIVNGKIKVSTATTLALDAEGEDYGIAIVVTENGVGPYDQSNYLAGQPGAPGDWGSKPNPASTIFNDVARYINSYNGARVFPGVLTAGTVYTNEFEVLLPTGVKAENCNIVAMLVNRENGVIENASMSRFGVSGVTTVSPDGDAPAVSVAGGVLTVAEGVAEVYATDGRRVATATASAPVTLRAGVYIVRTGKGVSKIAVR